MRFPRWLVPWRKQTDLNTVTPIRAPYGFNTRFGWVGFREGDAPRHG